MNSGNKNFVISSKTDSSPKFVKSPKNLKLLLFSILQKLCLERAREYSKRIHFEFDKWLKFGYTNSNPDLLPVINEEIERRWNKALPKVFRCTECGKYRLIEDFDKMKELDAAFFTCQDNPDSVSHFQRKK